MALKEHDWHPWNFSYSPFQVLIIGCDDIAPVSFDFVNQAIICISSLMLAREAFEPWVLGQLQSQTVTMPHLLQLRHNAVRHARDDLRQETVHHARKHVQLVLDAEINEVGINYYVVWRTELHVVLKIQRSTVLLYLSNCHIIQLCILFITLSTLWLVFFPLVLNWLGILCDLQTVIFWINCSLHLSELSSFVCFTLRNILNQKLKNIPFFIS